MESAVLQIKMQSVEKATLPWLHPYGMLQYRQLYRSYWKKPPQTAEAEWYKRQSLLFCKDIYWEPAIQTMMLLQMFMR